MTAGIIGWDIGGVNTKVARVAGGVVRASRIRPYEIRHDPAALRGILTALATEIAAQPADAHAVTMTAELSRAFRTKREGVAYVLDGIEAAFPGARVRVYTTRATFVSVAQARGEPIAVAAANWVATASLVARAMPLALLIDIGSTTTDIIPIVDGAVAALGRTDPERLRSGELLYLGAVRTPVEAIVHSVPLHGAAAGVSADGFAISGDVHLWRETLDAECYSAPTPDGRPATREYALERIARVVCGDRELLDIPTIDRIAAAIAEAQVARTADAITRVRARHPALREAVVAGIGAFLAAEAAERTGLTVRPLADVVRGALSEPDARAAAAVAVALLAAEE
jgi:(4-(4-[2-(gamma-L-glutamylamino)ethyl]phenoxymethyl)furan-2-yl)methanamine synthase